MKKLLLFLFMNLSLITLASAQNLKPYIQAGTVSNGSVDELSAELVSKLTSNGFKVLGSYNPVGEKGRKLIVVTHPQLISAVKKTGGLAGFASALRLAITREGNDLVISYTNPDYWGAAYFTKNFSSVSNEFKAINAAFKECLSAYGPSKSFGSENGLSLDKLKSYKYMFGMPQFEDNIVLGKFAGFDEAVKQIDASFDRGVNNLEMIYEVSIEEKQIKLYGVGLKGANGETRFMPVIDQASPKHTAFLPYEILVYKNKAYMMHGRYRIALSFPDLTMGTFMKIVSTPGQIEEMLKTACK